MKKILYLFVSFLVFLTNGGILNLMPCDIQQDEAEKILHANVVGYFGEKAADFTEYNFFVASVNEADILYRSWFSCAYYENLPYCNVTQVVKSPSGNIRGLSSFGDYVISRNLNVFEDLQVLESSIYNHKSLFDQYLYKKGWQNDYQLSIDIDHEFIGIDSFWTRGVRIFPIVATNSNGLLENFYAEISIVLEQYADEPSWQIIMFTEDDVWYWDSGTKFTQPQHPVFHHDGNYLYCETIEVNKLS